MAKDVKDRTPAGVVGQICRAIPDLQEVANWLNEHAADLDGVYVDWNDVGVSMQVGYGLGDPVEAMANVTRLLSAGAPFGSVRKQYDDKYLRVFRMFGTVEVEAWTMRELVCERRVVGFETVEVPDPDAPLVTVEREIVEWACHPILSEVSA